MLDRLQSDVKSDSGCNGLRGSQTGHFLKYHNGSSVQSDMQGSGGEAIQVEKVPKCWRRHLVLKEFSDGKTFLNIPINNENIKLIRSA